MDPYGREVSNIRLLTSHFPPGRLCHLIPVADDLGVTPVILSEALFIGSGLSVVMPCVSTQLEF